jgi:hypothetical protein
MANRGIQFFFLTIAAFAVSGVASQGVFKMASGGGTNCNGRSDCAGYIEWTVVGDTIRFTMESSANWIALGISADQRMGTDGIDDVLACQRDPANDNVFAKDTYNPQDQSTRGNSIDSNQDGLTMTSGMFDSGRLRCVFTREIVGSNAAEDRNLNESAFLLMAMGAGRAAANMALTPPHSAIMFSSDRVVLTDETAVTTPDGVFKMASGGGTNCKGRSDCAGYVEWTVVDDTIRFSMESSANWIALGLSADQRMGADGIDDVLGCQRDPVNDNVHAKDCYNPQDQSSRGNRIDSSQTGLTMTSGSFTGGRLRCVFTREIAANNAAEDRNLNESAFLLLAIGAGRAAATAAFAPPHSARTFSSERVTLTQETVITTSCVDDVLTRLHGALMYIAWGFLVPIALFFPAFMRPNFGKGEWFKIHLVLMLIALPISLIGLLFIIVAHRNSDGRIALGSENGTGTAHFVFGIVIIILQVANPIIAIFRCKPKSKNRWIFNLIHKYLIGYPVETFAWVSMGLGFARLADIRLGGNFNILWLYIAVAVAFGLLELVGGFGLWILCSVFKKDDDGDAVKMTKDDEKVQVPDSPGDNKTEPKKDWLYWLRWALFGIGATILVCGGIAILVLIFIGLSC